jgi:predicted nucleotidyltransferase
MMKNKSMKSTTWSPKPFVKVYGKYLERVKETVLNRLKGEPATVILFGSRARGDGSAGSDVDVGIIPKGMIDKGKLSLLREELENSNIPYKVELVNFAEVSAGFAKIALKDSVVWKD